MTAVVVIAALIFGVMLGWFLASLAWAAARAELDAEIMELRQRVWNLTRDETHA